MSGGPVPRSMGNRSVGAVGGGPAAMTTNGHAIVSELSRRVVASILLATGTTSLGAPEILSVLADLLTLSLLRMLRTASLRAQHAHRHLLNIFDVLPALGNFHLDARRLLEWARSPGRLGRALKAGSGSMSGGGSGRGPMLVPLGRSLLRALGDEEEEDEEDEGENMNMKGSGATLGTGGSSSLSAVMDTGGVRPTYLLDIYPPFPRSYTFRRTEVRITGGQLRRPKTPLISCTFHRCRLRASGKVTRY